MSASTSENICRDLNVYKEAFQELIQEFDSSQPRDVFAIMLLQRVDQLTDCVRTLNARMDQLYMLQSNEHHGILFDHHQTTLTFPVFFLSLNITMDGLDEAQPYDEQQAIIAGKVCRATRADKIKLFHCWWCNDGTEYIEIECLLYYSDQKTLKQVIQLIMEDAPMSVAMLKSDDIFSETHTYKGRLYGINNDMLKNKYEILLDKVNYCEVNGVPDLTIAEEDAVSGCYDSTGKNIPAADTFQQWQNQIALSEEFRRFFDVFSMPSMTLCNLSEYENFVPLESDSDSEDEDDSDSDYSGGDDDSEQEAPPPTPTPE